MTIVSGLTRPIQTFSSSAALDLWRSTDGGTTFTEIGGYSGSVHPDQHAIVSMRGFNGTSVTTVFVGNDGGIFRAADVYTVSASSGWTDLNNNLGITQFYGAAGNATSGTIVAGAQDNGTVRYTTGGGADRLEHQCLAATAAFAPRTPLTRITFTVSMFTSRSIAAPTAASPRTTLIPV